MRTVKCELPTGRGIEHSTVKESLFRQGKSIEQSGFTTSSRKGEPTIPGDDECLV